MKLFDNAGRPIKRERVRVIYRTDKRADAIRGREVTAIFPDMLENPGMPGMFTCYAHLGQHGVASKSWIALHTRPALAEEFADLHRELTGIYHDCELIISARMTRARG